MKRSHKLLLAGLLLILLTWLGSVLFNRLEPYEHELNHGPSPEARANPYLAAEHFLRARGLPVQHINDLHKLRELPSAEHTLIILGSRRQLTPKQNKDLLDWTSQGGHLVIVAESLWNEAQEKSADPLLDSLGIQKYSMRQMAKALPDSDTSEQDDSAADEQTPTASEAEPSAAPADSPVDGKPATDPAPEQQTEKDHYPKLTKLYLENEQAPAYISFEPDNHLFDSADRAHVWANSGEATHLLEIYQGQGLVTVLSDSQIWTQNNISRFDNAWLLWYLSQDSSVTLVRQPQPDNLFSLLLRYFPQALLALLLLVLASLWHLAPRQGPLLPAASRNRRQLQEHLRASADFLLRHAGQQRLLQGLQQDIQRRARQRQPGFDRLPVAEQWQSLSRLSRLTPSFISHCMRPSGAQRLSAADFTRQVANLQTLRNAL